MDGKHGEVGSPMSNGALCERIGALSRALGADSSIHGWQANGRRVIAFVVHDEIAQCAKESGP